MVKIKTQRNLKIGIIGCGWFGNFHIDNLLKLDNIEITAIYNRGIERLEKTGKKVPNARMYQDAERMIIKEKLDAVIISLTPDAHGEIEEKCAKKGIHMYIEKPIELSLENAERKNQIIKFSNVITSVGYQERYSAPLDLVREIIAKENIGLVYGSWIGDMPGPKWWRTKAESGGQVVEQTTHLIDMLRYLFGEVNIVYANGSRDTRFEGQEHDVEDYSTMVLTFKTGMTATVQSGCYTKNEGAGRVGFEIFTPRCKITYNWGKSLIVTSGERKEEVNIVGDSHVTSLNVFINAVRTRDKSEIKSTYEDALESFKVTLMANLSMETGKAVKNTK